MKKGKYWDSQESITPKTKAVIFVEGKDDAIFIDFLLSEIGANEDFVRIIPVDGKLNFEKEISLFKKSKNFTSGQIKSIMAFRDADDDKDRSESEFATLFQNKFQITLVAGETHGEDIKYGFFIFPDNTSTGDLEKLCLSTVENNPIHQHTFNYVELADIRQTTPANELNKRAAQIYLAGQPGELTRGVGMAFRRGFFDRAHQKIEHIRTFLRPLTEL